jgi:hypothetical protein
MVDRQFTAARMVAETFRQMAPLGLDHPRIGSSHRSTT